MKSFTNFVKKTMETAGLIFIFMATILQCKGLCPKPPPEAFGSFIPVRKVYGTGEKVRLDCSEGYVVQEDNVVTCLSNGQWDRKLAICVENVAYRKRVLTEYWDMSIRSFTEDPALDEVLTDGKRETCKTFRQEKDYQLKIYLDEVYSIKRAILHFGSPGPRISFEIQVTNTTEADHSEEEMVASVNSTERVVVSCDRFSTHSRSDLCHRLNGNLLSIVLPRISKPFNICEIEIVYFERETVKTATKKDLIFMKESRIETWDETTRTFIRYGHPNTILTDGNALTCVNFQPERDYIIETHFDKSHLIDNIEIDYNSTGKPLHFEVKIVDVLDDINGEKECAVVTARSGARHIAVPCRSSDPPYEILGGNELSVHLLRSSEPFQICEIRVFRGQQQTTKQTVHNESGDISEKPKPPADRTVTLTPNSKRNTPVNPSQGEGISTRKAGINPTKMHPSSDKTNTALLLTLCVLTGILTCITISMIIYFKCHPHYLRADSRHSATQSDLYEPVRIA